MATYKGGKSAPDKSSIMVVLALIILLVVCYIVIPIMKEKKAVEAKKQEVALKVKILKTDIALVNKLGSAASMFQFEYWKDPAVKFIGSGLPDRIARLEPKEWVCNKIIAKKEGNRDFAYLCLKYHQQNTNFEDIYISFPQIAMISGLEGREKSGFVPYEAQIFLYESPLTENAPYGNVMPLAIKLTYIHDQLVSNDADDHVRVLNLTYSFDYKYHRETDNFEGTDKLAAAPSWMQKKSIKDPVTIKYQKPMVKDAIPIRIVMLPSGVVARISYNDPETWELFLKRVHKTQTKQAHNAIIKRNCGPKPSLNDENVSSDDLRNWAICDDYSRMINATEKEDKNFHGIFGGECGKHPSDGATKEQIEAWDICANYAFD